MPRLADWLDKRNVAWDGRCDNASFLLDIMAPITDGRESPTQKGSHIERLEGVKVSDAYKRAFPEYLAALQAISGDRMLLRVHATRSPLMIGLGQKMALDFGLTLHRIYGVPYIPATSLKGAMKRVAASMLGIADLLRDDWYGPQLSCDQAFAMARSTPSGMDETRFKALFAMFGDVEGIAAVNVFDAMPVPKEALVGVDGQESLIKGDVVTPHHGKYYQKDQERPGDNDVPVPAALISVRPKVPFLFAVECPNPSWTLDVERLLCATLSSQGVGAKTNAGYGRFSGKPLWPNQKQVPPPADPKVSPEAPAYREGSQEIEAELIGKVRNGAARAKAPGLAEFELKGFLPTATGASGDRLTVKVKLRRAGTSWSVLEAKVIRNAR